MLYIFSVFLFFCSCATVEISDENKVKQKPSDVKTFETEDISFYHSRSRFLKDLEGEKTKDVDMLFKIANSFYDSGNYNEARKLYLDILKIKPDYANRAACHFNLGLISMKQNDWKESALRFRNAAEIFVRFEDVRDSRLLLMESLRNEGSWEKVVDESDSFLKDPALAVQLDPEHEVEAGLRKAEALIMKGDEEEGVRLAEYLVSGIRKKNTRRELLYDSNYAYGNYIMGLSESLKFFRTVLEETEESLLEKCRIILEAQSYYLKAIQTGVIYWTNACAFEISKLYISLYQEMISMPIPGDLDDDEARVYQCELWERISGLLTKPRRYLKKSVKASEKIRENNQYTEKSFELLRKIEELYEKRENECRDH